jgi:hypothetical protein
MDHAMLMWGLLVFLLYASIDKDFLTLVIEAKKLLKSLDSHGIMYILSNNGAEFNEILKAFYYLNWYMPFKCSQIHLWWQQLLHHISECLILSHSLMSPTYLYQHTGIVPSLLSKPLALRKPM